MIVALVKSFLTEVTENTEVTECVGCRQLIRLQNR
jgi:hypothetical protein